MEFYNCDMMLLSTKTKLLKPKIQNIQQLGEKKLTLVNIL